MENRRRFCKDRWARGIAKSYIDSRSLRVTARSYGQDTGVALVAVNQHDFVGDRHGLNFRRPTQISSEPVFDAIERRDVDWLV